ncbi:MAG: hypothetical protein ACXVKA_12920 [Acidimicrobiia bacterium]
MAAVELFDDVELWVLALELDVLELADDAEVAGVADQLLEVADEESVAVTVLLFVLAWLLSADVTECAAVSAAWTAIAPLKPNSAAMLAPAATFRARRAGCGRLRRGVASGIARSFVRLRRGLVTMVRDGRKRSRSGNAKPR